MSLRRTAVVLVASALACVGPAPTALAEDSPRPQPANTLPVGLHGQNNPKFDGVWRQSMALLGQRAAKVTPAKKAVKWLTDQQCADGYFTSYRPRPSKDCDREDVPDTNATAAAVQALIAVGGHDGLVRASVDWLISQQRKDGGWGFSPGSPSDANSVAVVIGALVAAGEDPATIRPKKGDRDDSAYDALARFQRGCDTEPENQRGAFAYQADPKTDELPANDAATVVATLAALGKGLVVDPTAAGQDTAAQPPRCDKDASPRGEQAAERAAESGAAYLVRTLKANKHYLKSAMPVTKGQPDYATTTLATVALAAGGHQAAAAEAVDWLEKNIKEWFKSRNDPAALGYLVLASHATGGDPADFGGVNLVTRLNATGPKPADAGPAGEAADSAVEKKATAEDDSNAALWWTIGLGLLAGVGIGVLISLRAKRRRS